MQNVEGIDATEPAIPQEFVSVRNKEAVTINPAVTPRKYSIGEFFFLWRKRERKEYISLGEIEEGIYFSWRD